MTKPVSPEEVAAVILSLGKQCARDTKVPEDGAIAALCGLMAAGFYRIFRGEDGVVYAHMADTVTEKPANDLPV